MLSPVYTPAPLSWLPPPRRSARGRRKNFPARRTREKQGFRDLFQHATEILQKSLPARTPELPCAMAGQERESQRGEGHQEAQPDLSTSFIRHLPREYRRRRRAAPHT
ncbi:unnamed protein product, partial [Bubo scandiacus]